MRLVLTADAIGGVWDYAATLARELESRGHAILLAVVGEPTAEQIAALPEGIAIECRGYRLEWMPDADRDLAEAAAWIDRLGRSWGASLIHLNQLAYTGAARFRTPTVVVVHSEVCSWFQEVAGGPPPPEWSRYVRWIRDGIHAASAVVAPTWYQATLVARHFGRVADRVVHNAVSPADCAPPTEKERLVVSAGRVWDAAKGISVLDRAVGLLGDLAPTTVVLGALDGPAGERYEPEHLTCPGRVPAAEVHAWMARASIYAGPSLYEPFGLAPLEAALHGCALLLSDIGSFRELWDGCAEFVPRGDAPALADAIARLSADGETARRLAAEARERALDRHGVGRFADEYESLYEELAGDRTLRPDGTDPIPARPVT